MGTQVQCETYFPGCYSTRDLNVHADCSWSQYYENKTLSGHLYSGFVLRPLNGYSEYDKEMLKQIMLEHEAIFRKQVYELHRLYRIQKELTDEFQKKGLCRYSVLAGTSQSNSFSSQMPSEGTKRIGQMPCLPVVCASYNTAPVAGTDDTRSPLNFFKESSVQSGQFPIENGAPKKDSDIQESKLKRFPRRMFDLQLPADVYIDSENADRKEKENVAESSFRYAVPSNKIYNADPGNDVKLTLGTGEYHSRQEDSWKSDPSKQNGFPAHSLADLNKPVGQIFREVSSGSASTHFLHPRTHREENLVQQLPMSSNTSFLGLRSALFKDRHSDEGSCSNFPYAAKEEIRRGWSFYNNEAEESTSGGSFFSSGLHNEKLPMSSEPIQLKPAKSHDIPLPNKADTWFGQKPTLGIEISGRTICLAILNNSGPAAPGKPGAFLANLDYSCMASPLVSALIKPVNSMSHIVQALSCFNGSAAVNVQSKSSNTAIQDSRNACDKWQHNGDLRPHLRFENEASSYPNGSHHHFQLESNSAHFAMLNLNSESDSSAFGNDEGHGPEKCPKGLQCTNMKSATNKNLNQPVQSEIRDGLTTQQDIGVSAVEQKCRISLGGISWLTRKPTCNEFVDVNKYASQMESGFSQGYPQLITSSNAVDPELEWRQEKEKGLSICNFQDFTTTSQVENRMRRNEGSDSPCSKKILGFPIFDKVHQNAICSPSHQEQSVTDDNKGRAKDGVSYIELSPDIKAPSLEKHIHVGDLVRISTWFRSLINLNSACTENTYSTEMSPEGEVEVPSRITLPSVAANVASKVDLEAPLASQMEENTLPQEESMTSSKTDGSQETECSHEALVREAAENIVRMSLDKCSSFYGITWGTLSAARHDTLQWFADVVSSNSECATSLMGGFGGSESSDDRLDHFELMTLKLEETKADEYWCKPQELENQEEEEKGATSLLLMRPRRDQTRRRQRSDFQKDNLPGLTSLSRHEVTEDLQTIGGLMKASGRSWQTGLTRRNTDQNGLHCQARGRRRPRSLAVTVAEIQVSSPPLQPTNAEFEVAGRTMIGWGRTALPLFNLKA